MSRDRGSIIPLVPAVVLALLILGGLVVDGSRDLSARGAAQAYAEEAARAGASAVRVRGASLGLDYTLAAQRVADYCAAAGDNSAIEVVHCGLEGSSHEEQFTTAVTCGGAVRRIVVNTSVTLRIKTSLLGIVGITTLDASGRAKARPFQGLSAADAC